jgi:hypothetical protein
LLTFYYDVTSLAVSSTTPTEGTGVLTAPGTMNLTLNFNAAFNPATLHAGDLVVGGLHRSLDGGERVDDFR